MGFAKYFFKYLTKQQYKNEPDSRSKNEGSFENSDVDWSNTLLDTLVLKVKLIIIKHFID